MLCCCRSCRTLARFPEYSLRASLRLGRGVRITIRQKADSTLRSSRAVPHPSTDRALRRLTSEVRRDPVHSTRYGRRRPLPTNDARASLVGNGRRRPYRVECTGSLLTSEVKRRRARSVLGWGTAREDLRVLSAFCRIVILTPLPNRSEARREYSGKRAKVRHERQQHSKIVHDGVRLVS